MKPRGRGATRDADTKRDSRLLPHFQVAGRRLAVVNGDYVKVFLQRQRDEGELDPVPLARYYQPRAVGVVGVAMGKTRRLDGAVQALDDAAAGLSWRREEGRETSKQEVYKRQTSETSGHPRVITFPFNVGSCLSFRPGVHQIFKDKDFVIFSLWHFNACQVRYTAAGKEK